MLQIGSVVWGVSDVPRAVRFWSEALHYRLKYPASEDWAILIPREGPGLQLSLSLVSSPRARRHHIDLFCEDQAAEVERLLALGARRKSWRYPEGPTMWCWKIRTATRSAWCRNSRARRTP